MSDSTDDAKGKNTDFARFRWHELALRDRKLRRSGSAVALLGYVMHRHHKK